MSEQKQILVVEDNPNLAQMLSDYFSAQGYGVYSTDRGEEALEQVVGANAQPDLILLDVNLTGIDGFETCRRLRQSRVGRHLPVLFLTERRERADRLAGLDLGAVDYVTKPFDLHELGLRVGNVLYRAQRRSPFNPLTGLLQGPNVVERLQETLQQPQWAIIIAGVDGLEAFRRRFGFVAADDVVRACALILTNAMEASEAAADFIGHVDPAEFAIITSPSREKQVAESCLTRLQAAIPYFYSSDSQAVAADGPRLQAVVSSIASTRAQASNIAELRAALQTVA